MKLFLITYINKEFSYKTVAYHLSMFHRQLKTFMYNVITVNFDYE